MVSGVNTGPLEVRPEKIHAEDGDTLRTPVEYEFIAGNPADFRRFFRIDPATGVVAQTQAVSRESVSSYNISVRVSKGLSLKAP